MHLPAGRAAKITVICLVVLLAAVIGGALGIGGQMLAGRLLDGADAAETSPAPEPVAPVPVLRAAGTDAPEPTPAGVAGVLDPLAADGRLGTLTGQVIDPEDGSALWSRAPGDALVPGSTAKLLTAAAALLALDHEERLTTRVVAGAQPGTVVLVGGGDPTLTALPAGEPSVYSNPARLDDLAAQVREAAGGQVSRVLVDVDRYRGDVLAPGWLRADVAAGFVAPIVPVMLDGGRADPTDLNSPRSAAPATAAAGELARRLGADPASVQVAAAPRQARVLGSVSSPTVEELVTTMLRTSDNVLAEALARQVAIRTGAEPSFGGAARAIRDVLAANGLRPGASTVVDGSGLSTGNRVTAELLTGVLAAAAAPDGAEQRTARLRPMLAGLPVAGGDGTLADRYTDPGSNGGRGWVRAKTGTLDGVSSLAGTVLDVDGRVLVFALMSNGTSPTAARPRLDALAASLRGCGCR